MGLERKPTGMSSVDVLGPILIGNDASALMLQSLFIHDDSQFATSSRDKQEKQSLSCSKPLDVDDAQSAQQVQILLQAQAVLTKSWFFQRIDNALQQCPTYHPNLQSLPEEFATEHVDKPQRDHAVANLRFLSIFYGCKPETFALAVNLLDRLLGQVKVHLRYLSCVAVSCFHIALMTEETPCSVPKLASLAKISQCGCTVDELAQMQQLVLSRLGHGATEPITALIFLNYFCEIVAVTKLPKLADQGMRLSLIAKLELLMCHSDCAEFRAPTLSLALLTVALQELGFHGDRSVHAVVLELQLYCSITDDELADCRSFVLEHLVVYYSQPTRTPRLTLVWSISKRTLHKLKPSTRCILDLEPILEDDIDDTTPSDSSDDAGIFDSEGEEWSHRYVVCTHCPGLRRDALIKKPAIDLASAIQLLRPFKSHIGNFRLSSTTAASQSAVM